MAYTIKKKEINPDFSRTIESEYSDSFFQFGFKLVNKLLYIFLFLFSMLISSLLVLGYIFYLNINVKGVGILEPEIYKEIKSKLPGIIENVFVKNGDRVSMGDPLAKLSDFEYQIRLSQAEKDLEVAKADLKSKLEKHKLSNEIHDGTEFENIRAKIGGVINDIYIGYGQKVKKGDVLLQLSDSEYQSQLSQEKMNLQIAQVELQSIQKNYDLSRNIYRKFIKEIPEDKSYKKVLDITVKETVVEKINKRIKYLEDQINKTRIISPCAGTILTHNLKNIIGSRVYSGEIILTIGKTEAEQRSSGSITIPEIEIQKVVVEKMQKQIDLMKMQVEQTIINSPISGVVITSELDKRLGGAINKGEGLVMVSQLEKWIAKVMIKEKDIPKISIGDQAKIKLNAFPFMHFKMFTGQVVNIAKLPIPNINQFLKNKETNNFDMQSTYYTVTIKLNESHVMKNNKKYSFQFGLIADVNIKLSNKRIIKYLFDLFIGKIEFFDDLEM